MYREFFIGRGNIRFASLEMALECLRSKKVMLPGESTLWQPVSIFRLQLPARVPFSHGPVRSPPLPSRLSPCRHFLSVNERWDNSFVYVFSPPQAKQKFSSSIRDVISLCHFFTYCLLSTITQVLHASTFVTVFSSWLSQIGFIQLIHLRSFSMIITLMQSTEVQ